MGGGTFGEVFSLTRPAFLISKLILGIGLGFYLTVAPLYASELAPIALRGIVTAGVNFAIVIGQLLSNAVIKGFGDRTDRWAYGGPFAVQWLFVGKSRQQLADVLPLNLSSNSLGRLALCSGISVVLRPQEPDRQGVRMLDKALLAWSRHNSQAGYDHTNSR